MVLTLSNAIATSMPCKLQLALMSTMRGISIVKASTMSGVVGADAGNCRFVRVRSSDRCMSAGSKINAEVSSPRHAATAAVINDGFVTGSGGASRTNSNKMNFK